MRLKRYVIPVMMVLVGLLIGACTPSKPIATPTPAGSGAEPGEMVIESIDLVTLESFPVQVQAKIVGQLPDVCAVVERVDQAREGNTFQIDMVIGRRPDARCAPNPTPFEYTIALDVYGLKAGTYTVEVQGMSGTFELAADNALPEIALVWHREGGIAGSCDEVVVYTTGEVVKQSCKGGKVSVQGGTFLDDAQLSRVLEWYTGLAPFEYEQKDRAVADAMTIRVAFHGTGSTKASEANKIEIQDWASQLWSQLNQPG